MELLGKSLEGNLRHREILDAGKQIVDCLEFIHGQGFTHRDIKPANIVWKDSSRKSIYVVDFGISDLSILPGAGTPLYMSIRTHQSFPVQNADDLESLAYTLLDYVEPLPWKWNWIRITEILSEKKRYVRRLKPKRHLNGQKPVLHVLHEFLLMAVDDGKPQRTLDYNAYRQLLIGNPPTTRQQTNTKQPDATTSRQFPKGKESALDASSMGRKLEVQAAYLILLVSLYF